MSTTQTPIRRESWHALQSSNATEGKASPDVGYEHLVLAIVREMTKAVEATAAGFSAVNMIEHRNQPAFYANYARAALCSDMLPYVQVETSPMVRALNRLRLFKNWGENWDAEGAPEPDKAAIDYASELLGYLKSYPIEPTAMLDSIGKPLLLFEYGGKEGEISVGPNGALDFVFDNPEGDLEAEADVEFDASTLPPSLEALLDKIRASTR